MKLKTLFILSIFLISIKAFSQKQSIAFNAGIVLSNINKELTHNKKEFKTSVLGGINYEYKSNTNWLYNIGLEYQQKGYKIVQEPDAIVDPVNYVDGTFTYKNNYIVMPLKIGYSFGSKITGNTYVGLVSSLLVDAKISNNINNSVFDNYNVKKIEIDALVSFGLGYNLNDTYQLRTAFRFQHGLMNSTNTSGGKMKHYSYAFMVSLRYNLNNNKD
jgi:hypothetical protein